MGHLPSLVSIPTRCDQNEHTLDLLLRFIKFQFRHGAIKTVEDAYRAVLDYIVSIPTRCDQNLEVTIEVIEWGEVSIPTRCDQNRFPDMVEVERIKVSIPTRCDQNKEGTGKWQSYSQCFNSDTVRSKRSIWSGMAGSLGVSIPTRCDQNFSPAPATTVLQTFQFRHGAIKTEALANTSRVEMRFNSDTVRSKPHEGACAVEYMEVSIPTRCDQNDPVESAALRRIPVSIPTRCDQNFDQCSAASPFARFQFRHGAIKTYEIPPQF